MASECTQCLYPQFWSNERERHNKILQRLSYAISEDTGDKYLEQTVREAPGNFKPDLVVYHKSGEVTIADVTIPFETDESAFVKARNEKKENYCPLAQWLQNKGHSNVTVDAFIARSLGSWDVDNEALLKRLNVNSKYAILFRKLCVVDAIKDSLAIWRSRT